MNYLHDFYAFMAAMILAVLAPKNGFGFPEGIRILVSLGLFFIGLLILTVVFYISGVIIVGEEKARFSDAFIISLLGTFLGSVVFLLLPGFLGLLVALVVWLLLIRHFYETGWLRALAVAILAVIVFFALLVMLVIMLGVLEVFKTILEMLFSPILSTI
jgi:hypothetical protein